MNHTFYVSQNGLDTQLDEVLSEEDYFNRPHEDFLPNRHWFSVTVRGPEDQAKWVAARNNYLHGAWTPNQDEADRKYYRKMMDDASEAMNKLEIK